MMKEAEAAGQTLSNPRWNADKTVSTWDCVWFGHYWQEDTNGDGVADQKDEKQPIKWRVLSIDGDDAFLLADKCLARKPYNRGMYDVTWETCTLRSWLNGYGEKYQSGGFINQAFDNTEQNAILNSKVVNENNPYYPDVDSGNDTIDKIYLLSIYEVGNISYGFEMEYLDESKTRKAILTEYGGISGCGNENAEYWWLRSPNGSNENFSTVNPWGKSGL